MASTAVELMRRRLLMTTTEKKMSISELVDALNDGETFTDAEVNEICNGHYGSLVKIKAGTSMKLTYNYGNSPNTQKTVDNTGSAVARYFWVDAGVNYTSIRALVEMNNSSAARGNILEMLYTYMPTTVTNIASVFNGATNISKINLTNWTGTYTSISAFVNAASALTALDMSAMTINCTSLYQFLNHCNAIRELHFGNVDFSNLTSFSADTWTMPFWATSLTTITGNLTNMGKGFTSNVTFNLENTNLNHDSAMVIINSLVAPTSGKTATIKFKSATYNTLSAEEKALITAAGWVDGNAS